MRVIYLFMFALIVPLLHAQPNTITIQGLLEDNTGNKINGEYTMTLSLYPAASNSQAVYGGTLQSVEVVSGTFAVELEMDEENNPFLQHQVLWLGHRRGTRG